MQRSAVINVVGLNSRCISADTPFLQRFIKDHSLTPIRPAFPALTCSAQSTYLTGELPRVHGIVGNGWYHREQAEHQFWKQSNHLVHAPKVWEVIRKTRFDFTCAKLFWWYNMYSTADYTITPRPIYPADGRKVFDIYTQPMGLRETIKNDLGEFPFPSFWGPRAGLPSSAWIAESALWVEKRHHPDLSLIYLPHLDYDFQRFGPNDPRSLKALREIDSLLEHLVNDLEKQGVTVTLLSEYGITAVDRLIAINRIFREEGWLTLKDELGRELLDLGASRAFAIADHQVAHIYVLDSEILPAVAERCASIPGVEHVLNAEGKSQYGIDHERAGDLVLVADGRSWFSYYYWDDDSHAPDFARCVDIHRKPGYDPAELFLDLEIRFATAKVLGKLARKKLGFRMLMDVIPLNGNLVKGSHGRIPEDEQDWPVFIGNAPGVRTFEATDVFSALLRGTGVSE